MSISKCFYVLGLIVSGCLSLCGGDLLDQLEDEVDQIEIRYWEALRRESTDPIYEEVREQLHIALLKGEEIQRRLTRGRFQGEYGSIVTELTKLRSFFLNARRHQIRSYSFSFERTGMPAYKREFLRIQREITREKAKDAPRYPTLKNVNLESYELWLVSQTQSNLKRFRRVQGKRDSRQDNNMRSQVSTYLDCIQKLRLQMAEIRQKSNLTFQ